MRTVTVYRDSDSKEWVVSYYDRDQNCGAERTRYIVMIGYLVKDWIDNSKINGMTLKEKNDD